MKIFLRWVLFVPTFIVVYIAVCWAAYYGPYGYLINFGPEPEGLISWLWLSISRDICAVALATLASCYVAPKGRSIIAALYAIITIFLAGFVAASYLIDPYSSSYYDKPMDLWFSVIATPLTTIAIFVYFAFGKQLGWIKDESEHPGIYQNNVIPFEKKMES